MCGCVAGFIPSEDIIWYLQQLRLRGADSWGLAIVDENLGYSHFLGNDIDIPTNMTRFPHDDWYMNAKPTSPKIGHTRWASVGKVSIENTHPLISFDDNVALIHNGTVTNCKELRDALINELNVTARGETDSEDVADYIDYMFDAVVDGEFAISLQYIQEDLKGTWAINFLHKDYPNHIFFLVKDSPLYFSHDCFCSEAAHFSDYFKIPNNSWGWLEKKRAFINHDESCYYELYINGQIVNPEYKENFKVLNKIEQEHINVIIDPMLAEIHEQTEFKPELEQTAKIFDSWWSMSVDTVPHYDNVQLFAMGSSYNAALLGRKYFRDNGILCSVEYASEYNYTGHEQYDRALRIAISQSGETADCKAVMQQLYPASTILLLTNKLLSSCSEYAHHVMQLRLPTENAIAATKTFSATCLSLLAMATHEQGSDAILGHLITFKEAVKKILEKKDELEAIAVSLANLQHCFVLGHDYEYAVARESALKLVEVSRILAQPIPIGEMKHGSLALQDEKMQNIVILGLPNSDKYNIIMGNCEQIKARHGRLFGIGVSKENVFDQFFEIPSVTQEIHPLICNVVMQLISYYIAKHKKLETTYISNLAKTVTVL